MVKYIKLYLKGEDTVKVKENEEKNIIVSYTHTYIHTNIQLLAQTFLIRTLEFWKWKMREAREEKCMTISLCIHLMRLVKITDNAQLNYLSADPSGRSI